MTAKPTLVFDLDGTLVETLPDLSAALNELLRRDGLPALPDEAMREIVGQGARVMIQRGYARNGRELSADRLDTLFADFIDHYSQNIADHSHPFPGLLDALDRLEVAGWTFAVCTNKLEALSKRLLDALGMSSRFAFIAGPDTFGVHKPDPQHILRTVEAAGGSRENAIMVGDSAADIKAAKAAPMPVIAVDFGYTPVPVRELDPDIVISDYDALWDAVERLSKKA